MTCFPGSKHSAMTRRQRRGVHKCSLIRWFVLYVFQFFTNLIFFHLYYFGWFLHHNKGLLPPTRDLSFFRFCLLLVYFEVSSHRSPRFRFYFLSRSTFHVSFFSSRSALLQLLFRSSFRSQLTVDLHTYLSLLRDHQHFISLPDSGLLSVHGVLFIQRCLSTFLLVFG